MTDLWTALADHAAPLFAAWADPDIAQIHQRLVAGAGDWWQTLEHGPRTLIHHDFNPRNVCLRSTLKGWSGADGERLRLCAYDWELATLGAPQRDLAELLCFVLTDGTTRTPDAGSIPPRRARAGAGTAIDAERWACGFRSALYDVLINRLAMYAVVHRVRRQPFLPACGPHLAGSVSAVPAGRRRMTSPASPLRVFHASNLLTYASLVAGVGAIAFAARGNGSAAGALIALSVVADTFDGRFAGLFRRTDTQRQSACSSTACRTRLRSASHRRCAWERFRSTGGGRLQPASRCRFCRHLLVLCLRLRGLRDHPSRVLQRHARAGRRLHRLAGAGRRPDSGNCPAVRPWHRRVRGAVHHDRRRHGVASSDPPSTRHRPRCVHLLAARPHRRAHRTLARNLSHGLP